MKTINLYFLIISIEKIKSAGFTLITIEFYRNKLTKSPTISLCFCDCHILISIP